MATTMRDVAEQMVTVLGLAERGRLPYPDRDGVFFPDDPALEDKAQTACGEWLTLVEGDGDPYVLLTVEGRELLAALRTRLAGES